MQGAWHLKLSIILRAEYGVLVLKTSCGFQQHIYQKQSKLRHISDKQHWRMLLSRNLILLFFQKMVEKFRKPDKDLFATRINKHLDRYVSWHLEPESIAINAFSLTWNNNYFQMFAPFSLVSRVLAKIHRDKTNAVIVVPDWSAQYWYPQLLKMANQDPLYYRLSPRNLTFPQKPSVNHPSCKKLQ